VDIDLKKPIHYAAACETDGPLRVLITAGANLSDLCKEKMTCLHHAAMYGRSETARLILETMPKLLLLRDKKGMTAMAYACKFGKLEVVRVLLEFGGKVNTGIGPDRMPPLLWAAAYGHNELVEFLIEKKARVLGTDKYKRTALIMAVRNGFTRIASFLL
jgi:ankyrin repeat protein